MIIIEKKNIETELTTKNTLEDVSAFITENTLTTYDSVRVGIEFKFAPDMEAEELFNPFNIEDVKVGHMKDIIKIREKQKEAKEDYLKNIAERSINKASTSYLESIGVVLTLSSDKRIMVLLKNEDERVLINMFTTLLSSVAYTRLYTCGNNGNNVIQFLQRCIVNDAYFTNDIIRQMIKAKSNANVFTKEDTFTLNILDLMSIWSFNTEKRSDRLSVMLATFLIKPYELGHKYTKVEASKLKTNGVEFNDELDNDKPICSFDLLDIPEEDLITLNEDDYKYYLEYKLHCMNILAMKFFGKEL